MQELINLINKQKSDSKIHVLDLGSNSIFSKLEFLFKNKRTNKIGFTYTAVDIKPEYSIYTEAVDDNNLIDEPVSSSEWIQEINNRCLIHQTEQYNLVDEYEFNETIRFNFKKDAHNFCEINNGILKYDIILLSNILHFIESKKADSLFSMCYDMLDTQGIIDVTILNDIQIEYPRINLYSKERFDRMKNRFEIINESSTSINFSFIGKK